MIPPTNPPPPCAALQRTLRVRSFLSAAANIVQQYGFCGLMHLAVPSPSFSTRELSSLNTSVRVSECVCELPLAANTNLMLLELSVADALLRRPLQMR